ncbi:MAG: large subunit ribosomal protein L28 [Bradymonadia bacterium]|jgi:large subunit ribosomal protein L28
MSRRCNLTGKRRNVGMKVSHSHIRTKKVQLPNIQTKRVWFEDESRWVRLRVSTRALRTISKKGLSSFMRDAGLTIKDIS